MLALATPVLYGLVIAAAVAVGYGLLDLTRESGYGLLGIGIALTAAALSGLRMFGKVSSRVSTNSKMWKIDKHHDLIDHWF